MCYNEKLGTILYFCAANICHFGDKFEDDYAPELP
jgi:hypothetical protein